MPNEQQNAQQGQGNNQSTDAAAQAAAEATAKATADAAAKTAAEATAKATADAAAKATADAAAKASAEKAAQRVVPEKYTLTSPDGFEPDAELMGAFEKMARERGLTNEEAQALADFGPKIAQKQVDAIEAAAKKQVAEWAEQVKADPEIGGANLNATLTKAKAVIAWGADKTFVEYLDKTGLGSHPAMIKLLNKMHAAIGEEKILSGKPGESSNTGKTAAEVLYPNQAQR